MKPVFYTYILLLSLLLLAGHEARPQAVSITYPNGGEVLHTATLVDIQWNYINVDNILIEYSLDGGFHWHTIISSIPSSALKYSWKVPPTPSDSCLVRITDILGGAQDESDAYFTIPVPSIRMIYPNEPGIVLYTNTIEGLEWETPDVDNVKLEYSLNKGESWVTVTASMDGFWRYRNWVVPNVTTTDGLFRITSVVNPSIFHVTEYNFSIVPLPASTAAKYRGGSYDGFAKRSNKPDYITLTHPVGGEVWTTNSTRSISWNFENVEDISIDISYDGGETWKNIITSFPASAKKYDWIVTGQTSTECKIRVRDIRTGVENISPEVFTIPPPQLTITYPRDGDVLMAQTIESVEWLGDDIPRVSIHYSLDGGATWTAITNNVAGNWNYFNWVVPNVVRENVLIKITDLDNAANSHVLTTGFAIIPLTPSTPAKYRGGSYDGFATRNTLKDSLQLLSPNGGEVFLSSQSYPVEWAYNNVDNLKIEFSFDNGNSWSLVTPSVPASALKYNWTVPSQPSQYCRIRITCLDNPELSDVSDHVFTIPHPPVSLVYPYAGVKLKAGTIESIEWESPGSESVKIQFSSDKGETWQTISANVNGHWGYFNWTVPSTLSDQCLIRITDNQNEAYQSTTQNVFSIVPLETGTAAKFRGGSYDGYAMSIFLDIHLLVRRPNGWEAYLTDEAIPIRWTHLNIEGKMRIQVTQDNEQTWQTIATGIPVEQRYFLWEGMRQASRWNKIRVVHESGLWEDKSDNFFIVGRMGELYTSAPQSNSFCAEHTISIPFSTNETYGPENMFIAQLSDEFGQFRENSDSLGFVMGTTSGIIHANIPRHVRDGSGYRIRVVSTDPPIIGSDNGTDLTFNALPDISLGNDTILCAGSSLILDPGFAPSNAYMWSTGAANVPTIEITTGGVYYVDVYNACGLATDTIRVVFRELPGNNLPEQVNLCHNGSVVLTASHPETVTYSWNNGQVTPSIVVNTPGVYTVTMTNACGQVQYATNVVGVDNPVVDLGDDFTLCGDEARTLSAPPGLVSYQWSTGSTQSSITVNTSGFYHVTVTDHNGCSSTSRSVRASVFAAPVVSIRNNGEPTICPGQVTELEAVGSFAAYQWYKDGVLLPGKTAFNLDATGPGSYQLTATEINGCQATAQLVLNSQPVPELSVPGDISITKGETVTLTAIYKHGTLMWSHGIENGVPFTPEASAVYTATLTSLHGCGTLTENVTITVHDVVIDDHTLTVIVKGNGAVMVNDLPYTGPVSVSQGTILDLDVVIQDGWPFVDWTGDLVSTNPAESVVMFSDKMVTARFGRLGDVNLDGSINITDVTMLVSYILERNPAGFYVILADVNQDDFINITDVVADVNIILYDHIYPPGKSFLSSQPAWISLEDGDIILHSDGTLAALQFEYFVKGNEKAELRSLHEGLHLAYAQHGDRVRGVIFSLSNQNIPQGRTELIRTNSNTLFSGWGYNVASNTMAASVPVEPLTATHLAEQTDSRFVTSIYPNPSRGIFYLQMQLVQKLDVDVILYDAHGRLVLKKESFRADAGVFTRELGSESFSPGLYIVQLNGIDPVSGTVVLSRLLKLMVE